MSEKKVNAVKMISVIIGISTIVLGVAWRLGVFETTVSASTKQNTEDLKVLKPQVAEIKTDVAVIQEQIPTIKDDMKEMRRDQKEFYREQRQFNAGQSAVNTSILLKLNKER